MALTHVETISVVFNEDQIMQCLEKYAISKYYTIEYGKFKQVSAVINVGEDGYNCELIFQKVIEEKEILESP